jgi:hypothetical protein
VKYYNPEKHPVPDGRVRFLVVPQMDLEAHALPVDVMVKRNHEGILNLRMLAREGEGLYYLDVRDYKVISWARLSEGEG